MHVFSLPELEIAEQAKPAQDGKWSFIRGLSASYGYGVALSPLQFLISASATITGNIIRPTLLKRTDENQSYTLNYKPLLSYETMINMRKLLYQTTQKGTARKASFTLYAVGAKTGSACKRSGTSGYDRKKHRAFLLAFFPIDNPTYAMIIMLDEPKGTKETHFLATAGWTIAPVAQKIIKRIGPMLKISALTPDAVTQLEKKMQLDGLRAI